MFENKAINPGGELESVKFSEKSVPNAGTVFIYVATVLSVAATLLIYLNSQNISETLEQKKAEKQEIINQILSPTYAEVEQKVADFRSSVSVLEEASRREYASAEFLTEFNKHIAKDIRLGNLNVTVDGDVALDGETKSYRSVADQLLLLQEWKVLKNVELASVSTTISESGVATTAFSITAEVDGTADLVSEIETTQEGGSR